MKTVFFLLLFVLYPFILGSAQGNDSALVISEPKFKVVDKLKVTVGINWGYNHNINGFRLSEDSNGNTYHGINSGFSLGTDFGIPLSRRIRTRIGLRYSEMKYGMNWDGPVSSTSDFTETVTKLYNFDLNLHFDYLFISRKHLQLFISPGLMSEFVMDADYRNEKTDGTHNFNKYTESTQQYPKSLAGGNLSFLAKYKINRYMGLTFSPGYTHYFRKFTLSNNKPFQRLNFNVGLEFTLF